MRVWILDTDEIKIATLNAMREHNLDKAVFYSIDTCSDENWLRMLKNAWAVNTYEGNELVATTWFDNFSGASAFTHFCIYPAFIEHVKRCNPDPLDWATKSLGITTFLGITPVCYRHVFPLLKHWGFEKKFIIPNACNIYRKNRLTDGILSMRVVK